MNIFVRCLGLLAAVLLSTTAAAQWKWIDKGGQIVFSDRGPPADVPEEKILKQPGRKSPSPVLGQQKEVSTDTAHSTVDAKATPAAATASAAPQAVAASAAKISNVDKELIEKKKQAEQELANKRKAEEEKLAKVKAENCERAQRAKLTLDSGVRIARTNKQGEREILDDNARAAELKRVQSIISSDCQ